MEISSFMSTLFIFSTLTYFHSYLVLVLDLYLLYFQSCSKIYCYDNQKSISIFITQEYQGYVKIDAHIYYNFYCKFPVLEL